MAVAEDEIATQNRYPEMNNQKRPRAISSLGRNTGAACARADSWE